MRIVPGPKREMRRAPSSSGRGGDDSHREHTRPHRQSARRDRRRLVFGGWSRRWHVDVCVAVQSDAEAESLVYTLTGLGYRQGTVIEQTATHRMATVRVHPPGQGPRGVVVDLLFASSGIEAEVVRDAERLEIIPGLEVPVACLGHLIALNVLARDDRRRPQDMVDLRSLLSVAQAEDLAVARAALELVTERGFHRKRDLPGMFEAAIEELS